MSDWEQFAELLADATGSHNREQATTLVDSLVERLRRGEAVAIGEAGPVLRLLRGQRWFPLVERAADALIQAGHDAPIVRRHLIQALLDQGSKTAAIELIERLIADTEDDPQQDSEAAEAWGLRGRAYKQLYVEADSGPPEHLREAIGSYHRMYERERNLVWHGINTVALVRRAQDDKITGDLPDGEQIARDILAVLDARGDIDSLEPWDLATAGEAYLALSANTEALRFLSRYAQSDTDAFALAGTLRQLEEVWQLTTDDERGAQLLPVLRAALLGKEGGGVEASTADAGFQGLSDIVEDPKHYEAILGTEAFEQVLWFKTALERAASVAIVETAMGQPQGTAFVMRAGDVSAAAPDPDTLVLVTNAHVISEEADSALHPDDAVFRFELSGNESTFRVERVRWNSPKIDLDITVVETSPALADVSPMPVARGIPRSDERVYVIGHPGGRHLSFSLYDNKLLNYSTPYLHYRTPTEGGNSGSPVFNRNWELIGLHHVGGTKTRVAGEEGLQRANEGISLEAINERQFGRST